MTNIKDLYTHALMDSMKINELYTTNITYTNIARGKLSIHDDREDSSNLLASQTQT